MAISTWIFRSRPIIAWQIERQKRWPIAEMPFELEYKIQPYIEGQVKLLFKYIAELPEMDRVIISLELEDIRQVEIASIVGLAESNVR